MNEIELEIAKILIALLPFICTISWLKWNSITELNLYWRLFITLIVWVFVILLIIFILPSISNKLGDIKCGNKYGTQWSSLPDSYEKVCQDTEGNLKILQK